MSLFNPDTIGSLAVRVLLLTPNGDSLSVSHRLDTTIAEGRTTIEERRPARAAWLLTQQCVISAIEEELDDWRKGLAALGPTLVAMPLWIDALPAADWAERIYEPQKVINFTPDTDSFAIYDAASLPDPLPYTHLAPLLVGRWKEAPKIGAVTDRFADIAFSLVEASPWECRIGVNAYGSAWPVVPDWSSPPTELSDYGLEQIALAGVAAREVGLDAVNAAPRWAQEAVFTFSDRLEIRAALSWFVAKHGSLESWGGLPAWLIPGPETGVTPHTYTARFASDTLKLAFLNGSVAEARVGFIQEIDTGVRAQALPGESYLYRLDYELDPDHPELFTNWDEPLVGSEGTFAPHQLSHQEIVRSLRPQDIKAELAMVFQEGSLAHDYMRGRLFGAVTLTVWQCDPTDVEGTRGLPLFRGDLTNVLPDGNALRLTAKLFGGIFDTSLPGWEFGEGCKTFVFSEECTLDEDTHKSTGTVAAADLSADGMTLTVHSVTGWGGPTYAAQWFAHGEVRTGSGRQTQQVAVMTSALSGGDLILTLARPMWADLIAGAGQSATILPGCGLQYVTDCGTKFDNQDNFRGEPFMPEFLDQVDPGQPHTPKK